MSDGGLSVAIAARRSVEAQVKWHTESQYGRNPVRVKAPLRAAAL